MKKLIQIFAAAVVGFMAVSPAFATGSQPASPAVMTQAAVATSKDVAGMDVLVQSLQAGMVRTAFVPTSRGRVGEPSVGAFSAGNAGGEVSALDETGDADGRMLVAGLVLMGVIAIRRLRS